MSSLHPWATRGAPPGPTRAPRAPSTAPSASRPLGHSQHRWRRMVGSLPPRTPDGRRPRRPCPPGGSAPRRPTTPGPAPPGRRPSPPSATSAPRRRPRRAGSVGGDRRRGRRWAGRACPRRAAGPPRRRRRGSGPGAATPSAARARRTPRLTSAASHFPRARSSRVRSSSHVAHQRDDLGVAPHLVLVLGQVLAELRGLLGHVAEDGVEVAVGAHQLGGGLLPHPGHARAGCRTVSPRSAASDGVEARRHAVALDDAGLVVDDGVGDPPACVHDLDAAGPRRAGRCRGRRSPPPRCARRRDPGWPGWRGCRRPRTRPSPP